MRDRQFVSKLRPVDKTMDLVALISADRESLDRLEGYCSNKNLAPTIPVLLVDLGFRYDFCANNLSNFQEDFEERLSDLQREARTGQEQHAVEAYLKTYRESQPEDSSKILVNCHEKYKAAYKAQKELLESGEFTTHLQKLFEKLPNLTGLCFMGDEEFGFCKSPNISTKSVQELSRGRFNLTTVDGIEHFLVRSHEFYEIESEFVADDEIVETARLFIDIPRALHAAGRRLESLEINYLPRGAYMSTEEEPTEAVWSDVAKVLKSSLEIFILDTEHDGSVPDVPSLDALSHPHTRRLIQSALSSEELQKISIVLGKTNPVQIEGKTISDPFPLQTVLPDSLSWPKVEHLELAGCRLPAKDMVRLCNGLGEELKSLQLQYICLSEGSWGEILAIICSKLQRPKRRRQEVVVNLDSLRYGIDEDQDTKSMEMSLNGSFRRST